MKIYIYNIYNIYIYIYIYNIYNIYIILWEEDNAK